MYDTPISLKYNYRHHAVNSILTLKVRIKILNKKLILYSHHKNMQKKFMNIN